MRCDAIAPGYFPSKMTDAIDDHGAQKVMDDAPENAFGDRRRSRGYCHMRNIKGERLRLLWCLSGATAGVATTA